MQGTVYALTFLTLWLLTEGIYIGLTVHAAPLLASPLNLGVAAPLVLFSALLGGLTLQAWSHLLQTNSPIARLSTCTRNWLNPGSPSQRARKNALLLGLPLLLILWFALGALAEKSIATQIKTPILATTLLAGIELVAALGLLLLAPLVLLPLEKLFQHRIFKPARILAAFPTIILFAIAAAWIFKPETMTLLPWHFVLGPLIGLCAAIAAGFFLHKKPRATRPLLAAFTILCLVLGLTAAYMPLSWKNSRQLFVGQPTIASTWYAALEKHLDYDNDGAIHLYAGNDCAPHDASRSPFVAEIINNGIDENCSGSDLQIDLQDFRPGTSSHPQPRGIARRPNIILITTDALTFSHTSLGAYHRDTTPNLAKWAERATVFENAFTLSSSTRLALPGLLAGQFNSTIPLKDGRTHPYSFAPGTPTLASLLKARGYHTVFVPGDPLFSKQRWPGLSLGFQVTDTLGYEQATSKDHTAPSVTARALHHIQNQDPQKPLFLWVHYFDHHSPYKTPKGHQTFPGSNQVDHFDNELHWTDHHWATLLHEIEQTWEPEDYVVVFTADHGESFDPNGRAQHHGQGLGSELLHVPVIIQAPEGRGQRVSGLVSHPDIPATLLNLAGITPPKTWIGESLIPTLFENQPVEKNILYSLFYIPEAIKRSEDPFWNIGVRTPDFLYLEDLRKGIRTLTDWKNDPLDQHDLSQLHPETLEIYRYLAHHKLAGLRENEKALSHLRK